MIAGIGHHTCTYNVTTRVQQAAADMCVLEVVCSEGKGGTSWLSAQSWTLICELTMDCWFWSEPEIDLQLLTHSRERERERGRDKRESFCVMEGKDTRRSSLESWFCVFLCVMSVRWRQPDLNTTSASHQRHVLYLLPRSRTHTLCLSFDLIWAFSHHSVVLGFGFYTSLNSSSP